MKKKEGMFFAVAIFLMIFGCTPANPEFMISPAIRYQGNILYIKNTDNVVYDSVKVEINGSFKKILPLSIPPGDEAQYELSSFLKDDGERFNIFKYGMKDITVSCEVSKLKGKQWVKLGKAFYYGKFN